jgi:V/A-type H+-transporting ATPase subunit D
MAAQEVTPTHSAYLELREERHAMEEGYRFLDEKRLILAAEILRELARYERSLRAFRSALAEAAEGLQAALFRHGLQGLEVYPAFAREGSKLKLTARSVLGVLLQNLTLKEEAGKAPPPVNPSPEAEQCRRQFATLIPMAAELAVMTGNLERLRREYARTARRARALEDVLLPETDQTLKELDGALEELEREEALRVRRAAGSA